MQKGNTNMQYTLTALIEQKRDLPALANAGAAEILIPLSGYSFTSASKMNLQDALDLASSAHAFGMQAAVLVNKIFAQEEMNLLDDLFERLNDDITHLYFADLAVLQTARRYHMENRLVYDPDTLLTSRQDIGFWHSCHLAGAVVSPLLTIEETIDATKDNPDAILFIHGHPVLSRSRRPLLSSWKQAFFYSEELKGRQDLYLQEAKRQGKMPVFEDENGTIIYSDDRLESWQEMNQFMQAGISHYLLSGLYEDRLAYFESIKGYHRILQGENAEIVQNEVMAKTGEKSYDSGYYHEKTVR
ncbi:MAG: U32 family peptidase [Erysipelotrichaceae bacterium]|nr:U32 family peptidase [Erysipelotrichaceae bacterium]MCH4044685.1 U32 family peptidase [Erysipelotrichaceae bacterium]